MLLFLRLVCTTAAVGIATLIGLETLSAALWVQVAVPVAIMVLVAYIVTGVAPRTPAQQHPESVALAAQGPARFRRLAWARWPPC